MNHKSPIQLRFKDIDALGHVNNANHLTYFETARIQYFNDLIGSEIDWEKEGMILARITVDYKQPIYLKDKIFVYTGLLKTGTTSFELEYKIVREENDGTETIMSIGTSVIVCYDYVQKKPIKIPESWLKKMST
ncbi:thioesterase family protein [soil metagenome]